MDIDLPPKDYRSESAKQREPIFGDGAYPFVMQLLGLCFAFALILAVATLGIRSHAAIGEMLFGKTHQDAPHLEPGESTVINGVTIKRIN